MGNIKRRLTRLENMAGGNMALIVIMPGETEEQAREKYFAANPECKGARDELVIVVNFTGENNERD